MKRVSTSKASPHYVEAFRQIIERIERSLKVSGAKLTEPVKMFIAGGTALHFYTGARISEDIDATFSRRLLLPQDLQVSYNDADGTPRLLYFDRQYSDSFGLIHDDADRDSRPLNVPGVDPSLIDVRLFTPLDLAVSKLARFEEVDQNDIRRLAQAGLLDVDPFRVRAGEALGGYIGVRDRVQLSIELACKIINESSPKVSASSPRRR